MRRVYIGFDPREADAFAVARSSIRRHMPPPRDMEIRGVVLDRLKQSGLYTRPVETRRGKDNVPIMWDTVSGAAMSTQHANARFLVPVLQRHGLALFMDGDVLVRTSLDPLFDIARSDPSKAVWVVKHRHEPDLATKMDGQEQARYARKNWSSVCLWNCDHPSTRALTAEMVNNLPGRDLHRFCWMPDDAIGELDPAWNHLVGVLPRNPAAKIVHFTLGTPSMVGYHGCEFADEWRDELNRWAA